jgi:hypothetical protein
MLKLLVISLSALSVHAQTQSVSIAENALTNAAEYFHAGAQLHIKGMKKEKETVLTEGLKKYPNDPLLLGLSSLKPQEQPKQQQKPKNSGSSDQEKQDQQQQQSGNKGNSQEKQDQQQQNANKNNEEQNKQDQAKQEQKQKQENQKSKQGKEGSEPNQANQSQSYAAAQMTPDQAKQLLDAQKGDETVLPIKPVEKPKQANRSLKDW